MDVVVILDRPVAMRGIFISSLRYNILAIQTRIFRNTHKDSEGMPKPWGLGEEHCPIKAPFAQGWYEE